MMVGKLTINSFSCTGEEGKEEEFADESHFSYLPNYTIAKWKVKDASNENASKGVQK